ncbi:MAG: hypothetical protein ACXAC2_09915 [Candidatus Kariarchaeaceae archaeon]
MPTMLILFNGMSSVVFASQTPNSNEDGLPGFGVIASLLALGIIAFIAPFLRKDKNSENQ